MMEHVDYGFGFTARGWAQIKQHMNVVSFLQTAGAATPYIPAYVAADIDLTAMNTISRQRSTVITQAATTTAVPGPTANASIPAGGVTFTDGESGAAFAWLGAALLATVA